MKGLMSKGSKVALLVVVFSLLLAPFTMVQAGEEDIPRIFSIGGPSITYSVDQVN